MSNIILTGMPGSGKSTLGVVMARRLGYGFMDTDLMISQKEKNPLQKIIDDKGLEYFLETENEIGSAVMCDRVIIATGGSMVMSDEAMKHLCEIGTVVFIDVPMDELRKRLGNYKDRGIAMNGSETLDDIYEVRKPMYEKYADLVVKYKDGNTLEQTVDDIIKKLNV